jgi:hypothetical protein
MLAVQRCAAHLQRYRVHVTLMPCWVELPNLHCTQCSCRPCPVTVQPLETRSVPLATNMSSASWGNPRKHSPDGSYIPCVGLCCSMCNLSTAKCHAVINGID